MSNEEKSTKPETMEITIGEGKAMLELRGSELTLESYQDTGLEKGAVVEIEHPMPSDPDNVVKLSVSNADGYNALLSYVEELFDPEWTNAFGVTVRINVFDLSYVLLLSFSVNFNVALRLTQPLSEDGQVRGFEAAMIRSQLYARTYRLISKHLARIQQAYNNNETLTESELQLYKVITAYDGHVEFEFPDMQFQAIAIAKEENKTG